MAEDWVFLLKRAREIGKEKMTGFKSQVWKIIFLTAF